MRGQNQRAPQGKGPYIRVTIRANWVRQGLHLGVGKERREALICRKISRHRQGAGRYRCLFVEQRAGLGWRRTDQRGIFPRKLGQQDKGDQDRILDMIDAWSKKS